MKSNLKVFLEKHGRKIGQTVLIKNYQWRNIIKTSIGSVHGQKTMEFIFLK